MDRFMTHGRMSNADFKEHVAGLSREEHLKEIRHMADGMTKALEEITSKDNPPEAQLEIGVFTANTMVIQLLLILTDLSDLFEESIDSQVRSAEIVVNLQEEVAELSGRNPSTDESVIAAKSGLEKALAISAEARGWIETLGKTGALLGIGLGASGGLG